MASTTVVTAYYPIKSKFPHATYMRWAANFLAMKAPVVLYTEPELVATFQALRDPSLPTHIVPLSFQDLDAWVLYGDLWRRAWHQDHEKAHHTPELYAVWAQKVFFVTATIDANPFQSSHFYWCDIGAFRQGPAPPTFPLTSRLVAEAGDRLLMNSVAPLDILQDWQRREDGIVGDFRHVNRIVGGLWGGSAAACRRWRSAYESQLLRYAAAGRFVGKDQSIFLSAVLEQPELATVVMSSQGITGDACWFFQQALLSNPAVPWQVDMSYPRTSADMGNRPPITVNLMGGLGNQMFQIAALIAFHLQHPHTRLVLPEQKEYADTRPVTYWDSVFHRFQHLLLPLSAMRAIGWMPDFWEAAATVYSPFPAAVPTHGIRLRGYFQTPRYYSAACSQLLKTLFRPSMALDKQIQDTYADLLADQRRVVVVHARRGDYTSTQAARDHHGPLGTEYYRTAIDRVLDAGSVGDPLFLLCSDDPLFWVNAVADIPALQTYPFRLLGPDVSDVETMALLSQFGHFVIANSSFSWWSAFLSVSERPVVVAPAAWFGSKGPSNFEDIYPSTWIRV